MKPNVAAGAGSLPDLLSRRIVTLLWERDTAPGDHVAAQGLADALNVSRSPIYAALERLADQGILHREPRRGYFLAEALSEPEPAYTQPEQRLDRIYFQLAEDRLSGVFGDTVSENQLRQRYDLSPSEARNLLNKVLQEGWVERRPGYGWTFSAMLTTKDALVQTYRLRAAIEPAGLREPTFEIAGSTLDQLETVEKKILDGGLETMSSDALYRSGVAFHETLAAASGNPYILDSLRRVNRIRRLLAYRANTVRQRYFKQANEHLEIIDRLRLGRQDDAAVAMQHHINTVILNLEKIDDLLRGDER